MTADQNNVSEKMTAIILGAIPAVIKPDISSITDRAILAAFAIAGVFLAIATDPPSSKKQIAVRFGVGIALTVIFGPWIGGRLGYSTDGEAMIVVAGLLGMSSWYVVGAINNNMSRIPFTSIIAALAKIKFTLPTEQSPSIKINDIPVTPASPANVPEKAEDKK